MCSKLKISNYIANLKKQKCKKVKYFNYYDFKNIRNEIKKYYKENEDEILKDEVQLIKRQNELYREKRNLPTTMNIVIMSLIIPIYITIFYGIISDAFIAIDDLKHTTTYTNDMFNLFLEIKNTKNIDKDKVSKIIDNIKSVSTGFYIRNDLGDIVNFLQNIGDGEIEKISKYDDNYIYKQIEQIKTYKEEYYRVVINFFILILVTIGYLVFLIKLVNPKRYFYNDKIIEEELKIINRLLKK